MLLNILSAVALFSSSIAAQSASVTGAPVSTSTSGSVPAPTTPAGASDGGVTVPTGDVDARCPSPFAQCKSDIRTFDQTTCLPLASRNASLVSVCRCYQAVNLANCYALCQDPQVAAELSGSVNPQITSYCSAVNLNPRALPQPAPWQTAGLSVSGSTPTGTARPAIASGSSSTSTGAPAPSASGRSSAVGSLEMSSTMSTLLLSSAFAAIAGLIL